MTVSSQSLSSQSASSHPRTETSEDPLYAPSDVDILFRLADCPGAVEVLQWLRNTSFDPATEMVAVFRSWGADVLEGLAGLAGTQDRELLLILAEVSTSEQLERLLLKNPHLPDTVKTRVEENSIPNRLEAARNEDEGEDGRVDTALFTRLAYDPCVGVRVALADNDAIPPGIAHILAHDSEPAVRARTAEYPFLAPETFALLAADPRPEVAYIVAYHASIPVEILARLAGSEHRCVRMAVADNPRTPADILARFALGDGSDEKRAAAQNSSTPVHVLEALAEDEGEGWWVKRGIASNAAATPYILTCLARFPEAYVQSVVAERSDTPAEALTILAANTSDSVRVSVARNRNTPADVLERLADDGTTAVVWAVAQNPSTPLRVLDLFDEHPVHAIRGLAKNNRDARKSAFFCRETET